VVSRDRRGSHRGFDHLELATYGPLGPLHYARWLATEHPEAAGGYYPVLDKDFQVNAAGGGDTGAPQVKANPIERGWGDDVDVLFTSDHGDFDGDFGLLFKGPYHVDSLMRLPLVWRPAPSCAPAPTVVTRPVGLVDLAPTFCAIAGLAPMEWMQDRSLPVDDEDALFDHQPVCHAPRLQLEAPV